MNFFEEELKKLFDDGTVMDNPAYTGRVCFGSLGQDLSVKAQFITNGYADHYDSLELTVLNRTGGAVDNIVLRLKDLWGMKSVPNNPNFQGGVAPHIWVYRGKAEWYAYQPTQADREVVRKAAADYLSVFRKRTPERLQGGPRLVYICAPLRGNLERNIEFARQKAQEVFQNGDIPVCPHLLFPPIADADDPSQDEAARAMGLRLVESCQQVNVYGPEWTEGMWAEIEHANKLGIPLMTDRKSIGRPPKRTQETQR